MNKNIVELEKTNFDIFIETGEYFEQSGELSDHWA